MALNNTITLKDFVSTQQAKVLIEIRVKVNKPYTFIKHYQKHYYMKFLEGEKRHELNIFFERDELIDDINNRGCNPIYKNDFLTPILYI